MREFETGATRDDNDDKVDWEGFFSPLVFDAFGQYMHKHRKQKDGKLRDSDNWQKGMPLSVYMKSGWRHFFAWWWCHRGHGGKAFLVESLVALMFNVMGYLHEILKEKQCKPKDGA